MKIMKELKEIVDPQHTALIIIDPQHDFCSEEGGMAKVLGLDMSRIQAAVPKLNKFIEECRKAGVFVVWVNEIFADSKMLPNQKAIWGGGDDIWLIKENGPGVEWYKDMVPPQEDEPLITKWQYDAFEDTALHLLLQSKGIETLLLTGFTSNVCVETTARHGYLKGYYIVAVSDCTDAPSKAEYESSMFNIKTYFGKACTSEEIASLWK
jgi:ureidoacrylate peracid hydrolase